MGKKRSNSFLQVTKDIWIRDQLNKMMIAKPFAYSIWKKFALANIAESSHHSLKKFCQFIQSNLVLTLHAGKTTALCIAVCVEVLQDALFELKMCIKCSLVGFQNKMPRIPW